MLGTLLALTTVFGIQLTTTESPKRELPVSIERIRAGLEQKQVLRLTPPDRKPDFRVEIQERKFVEDLLDRLLNFKSGPVPPGGLYAYDQRQRMGSPVVGQTLMSVDMLGVGHALLNAVASARRA